MNNSIQFKTQLEYAFDHTGNDGRDWYYLKSDLVFFNGKKHLTVRPFEFGETFLTDMASTPKFLHFIIPPDKRLYKRAAVLHDYLYTDRTVSRRYADRMFLLAIRADMKEILVNVGNPRTKLLRSLRYTATAYIFYLVVRIFGKSFRT